MTKRAIVAMAIALLVLTLTVASWADSQVRIVRLSYVDGPVQLDRGGGQGFDRAILNMPITSGMTLWTKDDSHAEVEFEDGTTLRLTPGTKVDFTRLALTDDGTRSTLVTIESGQVYVDYSHKKNEDFRIRVGQSEMALTKNVQFRIDVAQDKADLAVFKGELIADGATVKKNHTAELNLDNGTYLVAKGIAPAADDRWNHDRTDYHDAYMRTAYSGSSYYGLSDLNYYGSWYGSPYGTCWRPFGYSAAWNPYSSGAWVWYPGYGYSFVSLYPWGWQPYRMGAWNYVGGTGWCWCPNGAYYGLGWAPVYNAPVGFVPIRPPATRPATPTPPTQITTGPPPHRPPIVPVGDVDAQNWRVRHLPALDGEPGFHGRAQRGVFPNGGAAGTTSTSTGATAATTTRRSGADWTPSARRNAMNNGAQAERAPREERPAPRMERAEPSAPRMSAPAPAPAPPPEPRMSTPPPARESGRPPK